MDPLTASGCRGSKVAANSVSNSGGHSLREFTGVNGNLNNNNNGIHSTTTTTATNRFTRANYNNPPSDDQQYYDNNNNNNSNNNYRSHHYRDRNQGTIRNQARAGRFAEDQAARAFQEQSRQFDTGSKKFVERLQASQDELVAHVHRESKCRTTKNRNSERFKLAASEIARRESVARLSVVKEVKKLLQEKQYGYAPREKPDNAFRLMFENWNSLGAFGKSKHKIDDINALLKKYDVDCLAGCETQADWSFATEEEKFKNLFGLRQDTRCQVGYNTTEEKELRQRCQYGGTAMMTLGRLSTFVIDSGTDFTGLGRWTWILVGSGDKRTRIVVAYQPSKPTKTSKGQTVFEQHQRYFQPRGDFRSPRTILFEQLTDQLLAWRNSNEEIILCGDFNEHVYTGRFAQRLAEDDLLMTEQCQQVTGEQLPATFVTGSRPIDAVFATPGASAVNATILQQHAGVGDHKCFIVDFTSESILGSVFPRIIRSSGRKLHCDCERLVDNYNDVLNTLADRHRLFEKLNALHLLADTVSKNEFMLLMNRWDDELTDYMKAAENRCHKFKQNIFDYSPEISKWWSRRWLLKRVERYLKGKVPDPRNLFRDCKKVNIDPRTLTIDDLGVEVFIVQKKLEEFLPLASKMRRKHLKLCLGAAQKRNDEKASLI